MPRMVRQLIRILLSFTIFIVVLRIVGIREVAESFNGIAPLYLVMALGLVLADSLLRAANWNQLLSRFVRMEISRAWLTYIAGTFYGSALPSTIGTDAARAMTVARRASVDIRVAIGSLITLNVLNVGAVGTLGALAGILMFLSEPSEFLAFGVGLSVLLSLTVVILLFTVLGKRLLQLLSRATGVWPAAQHFFEPLLGALLILPKTRMSQLALVSIALLNQAIRATLATIVAASLGVTVDWWIFAAIAPIVAIVAMMPLSFVGLGIEQGAMVLLLDRFGVSGNDAFAISVTIASLYIVLAVAGGIGVIFDSTLKLQSQKEP